MNLLWWRRDEDRTTKAQDVDDAGFGTPESALGAYLIGWQKRDARAMAAATQVSYILKRPGIRDATIVETMSVSPVVADVIAQLTYTDGKSERCRFRVVRESADGEPSPDGDWGVNPSSIWFIDKKPDKKPKKVKT